MLNLAKDVAPISALKSRTAELLRSVAEDRRALMITHRGKARAVVIDVETYQRWHDAMAMLQILARAEAEIEAGKTVSHARALSRAQMAARKAALSVAP
jgi:prevent-host-death family protein